MAFVAACAATWLVWIFLGRPAWGSGMLAGALAVLLAMLASMPLVLAGLNTRSRPPTAPNGQDAPHGQDAPLEPDAPHGQDVPHGPDTPPGQDVSSPVTASGSRQAGQAGAHRAAKGPILLIVAGGVRLLVALAAAVLAVVLGDFPPVATLLTVIPLYFVLMAAETWAVVRSDWNTAPT